MSEWSDEALEPATRSKKRRRHAAPSAAVQFGQRLRRAADRTEAGSGGSPWSPEADALAGFAFGPSQLPVGVLPCLMSCSCAPLFSYGESPRR